MRDEKDLVQKISLLKEIEPKDNWVLFAKNRVIEQGASAQRRVGQESLVGQVGHLISTFRYLEKPALIFTALAFVVLGGASLQISQRSLPGDALYPLRAALEKATLNPEEGELASLELAQRRLADLKRVVEENRVRNLSTATQEFTRSVAEVSRGFKALVEKEPDKALQASRELVQLQKDKAQVEQILGAAIGEEETFNELRDATRFLAATELNDLRTRTLNEEQTALLEAGIAAYAQGDYEKALEYVWQISNQ